MSAEACSVHASQGIQHALRFSWGWCDTVKEASTTHPRSSQDLTICERGRRWTHWRRSRPRRICNRSTGGCARPRQWRWRCAATCCVRVFCLSCSETLPLPLAAAVSCPTLSRNMQQLVVP